MNIYPAIDLLGGRCVRLSQGRFDAATVYRDDPVAVAAEFAAAGAKDLHVVDLEGSRDGGTNQAELIRRILGGSGLRVQVGGGIRSVEAAASYVAAGVDRLVIGSLAVRAPEVVRAIIDQFGPERVTLALDLRPRGLDFELAIQGWTETVAESPWRVVGHYRELGVRRVLCTDISRDGLLAGPNLDLYLRLLNRFPDLELLASGGVSQLADLTALERLGAHGVIIGKALYAGRFTIAEAVTCCANV